MASKRTVEPWTYRSHSSTSCGGQADFGCPYRAASCCTESGWPVAGLGMLLNGLSTRSIPPTAASVSAYPASAATLLLEAGSPGTSTSAMIGVVVPGSKSRWSATAASRLSSPAGSTNASGMPCSSRRNGVPAASSSARVGIRTMIGRAITAFATRSQRERAGPSSGRGARPVRPRSRSTRPPTDSASTRVPSIPSRAGRKVSAKNSDAATVSIPPMPNDRSAGALNASSPPSPVATAMPEKVTALPDVATAISTASPTVRPRCSSSRNRLTMNSE